MDLSFPLAARLLGAEPFRSAFSDPSFFKDSLSGSTFRPMLLGGSRAGCVSGIPCNMYEKDQKYEYRFELPGCGEFLSDKQSASSHLTLFLYLFLTAQEKIDLSVENNNELMIKCDCCKGCSEDYDTCYMQECQSGAQQRTLKLPLDADPDAIVSCYANGILSGTKLNTSSSPPRSPHHLPPSFISSILF